MSNSLETGSATPASLPRPGARALVIAACLALPLLAGGCQTGGLGDITGSIATHAPPPEDHEALRRYTEQWGKRNETNPTEKTAAINYARGLRAQSQYAQAAAVMQRAAAGNPKDLDVLGAYGKALADAGRLAEASEVLERAHTPERPNWSVLSAQGSVADQMGDHATAQSYYDAALKIVPGEPTVLSNLGLSYALTKQLPLAEQTLREAVQSPRADSRVRQNLTLVLSLEGKFSEAEQLGRRDLPPDQATANVAAIRTMIAQSNTWRDLQKIDGSQQRKTASATRTKTSTVAATPAAAPTSAPIAKTASGDDGVTQ